MELSVGTVVEGKVKQITKFGAFILLPDHSTGMVHISEIAHSFVNDIHDHLTEGQTVNVLVIGNENGKVNLSIKRTLEPPAKPQFSRSLPVRRASAPPTTAAARRSPPPRLPRRRQSPSMICSSSS